MSNLALLKTEEDIVQKMDFTYIIDLSTAAKTWNHCFKCFVLRTYLQFWISFSSISGPKILLLSFQLEKYPFSNFCDFCIFTHEYKAKVSCRSGPVAPDFSGAPRPMWS